MAKLVSKVYGDALFSLALEENKLDAIWDEVKAIREALKGNEDFLKVLCHPDMSQEKKWNVITEVFKEALSEESMGFLNVMIRKGRIGELPSVLEYFDQTAKEYNKIGVVEVTTPIPLTDAQKEQVENKILEVTEYETLEMDYQLKKELLGGMVIRIGDHVLDNSIKTKLDLMTRQLMNVKLSKES